MAHERRDQVRRRSSGSQPRRARAAQIVRGAARDLQLLAGGAEVTAHVLPVEEEEPVLALRVLESVLQQASLILGDDRNDSIASLTFRAAYPREREIRGDIFAPSP